MIIDSFKCLTHTDKEIYCILKAKVLGIVLKLAKLSGFQHQTLPENVVLRVYVSAVDLSKHVKERTCNLAQAYSSQS